MLEVGGLARHALPGQDDPLGLLVVEHVLVGRVRHGVNVRQVVRPRLELVLALALIRKEMTTALD